LRFLFVTTGLESNAPAEPFWIPLGFAYIGALLKKHGHDVHVFDRHAAMARWGSDYDRIDQAMLDTVKSFAPDVVGFATISPLIHHVAHCAQILRKQFDGMILAGGHHATAMPHLTLEKIPGLDGVGIGEGEESLLALAEGNPPDEITGLLWRQNCHLNQDRENLELTKPVAGRIKNLDSLPFPDFSLFDTAFYTRRTSSIIRGFYMSTLTMLCSRGCSKRCSFCTESLVYGGGVRFHSAEYIIEMVERTLRQYPQVDGIYFHDNDFLIEPERAEHLCKKFIKTGLAKRFSWAVQVRADRLEPVLLKLMKKAGCIKMEIGVEAATQNDLDFMQKDTTADINEKALRLCRETGISVHAYMLTKTADESLADLQTKLNWLKQNRPDTFILNALQRFPGSLLYRETGDRFFETHDWTIENIRGFFNEDIFSKVSPQERQQWMQSCFEPFYRSHHRFTRLKRTSPLRWPQMYSDAIRRRLKRYEAFRKHEISKSCQIT
jgi:radical SAM superfamily enzyme YgiQ (UPF0313 family)